MHVCNMLRSIAGGFPLPGAVVMPAHALSPGPNEKEQAVGPAPFPVTNAKRVLSAGRAGGRLNDRAAGLLGHVSLAITCISAAEHCHTSQHKQYGNDFFHHDSLEI